MTCTRLLALAVALSAIFVPAARAAQPSHVAHAPETLTVPSFGTVTIYRGAAAPQQVVIFISGDGGWNLGVIDMAQRLRDAGALVVGVDIRAFMKSLDASARCAYPAGALEELSRAVQQHVALPAYIRPILVGYSSGATLVYAAVAAAPPETFAGAISLGFCSDIEIHRPLCQMRGLKAARRPKGVGYDLSPFPASTVPWMVLQGESDQVCAPDATRRFVGETGATRLFSLPRVGHGFGVPGRWASQFLEAYRAIAATRVAKAAEARASAPAVADLSLVEVPVRAGASNRTMAIVLTGDGGWADIDRSISAGLAAKGIPVVGWSSLDYYWTPRTPDGAAHDLARIIEHYQSAWHAEHVLVIGYSFGADVAPLLVNRLPSGLKARVQGVALLGPSDDASFEFHLLEWLGKKAAPAHPTAPEIARLRLPVTCVFAADEADSVCRTATASGLRAVAIGHGHHFSGDYDGIVEAILR